jgi:hypothetical protein
MPPLLSITAPRERYLYPLGMVFAGLLRLASMLLSDHAGVPVLLAAQGASLMLAVVLLVLVHARNVIGTFVAGGVLLLTGGMGLAGMAVAMLAGSFPVMLGSITVAWSLFCLFGGVRLVLFARSWNRTRA